MGDEPVNELKVHTGFTEQLVFFVRKSHTFGYTLPLGDIKLFFSDYGPVDIVF